MIKNDPDMTTQLSALLKAIIQTFCVGGFGYCCYLLYYNAGWWAMALLILFTIFYFSNIVYFEKHPEERI